MSEFLKNLNEALANKIFIDRPHDQIFTGKIGLSLDMNKVKQFVLTPTKELIEIGPAIQHLEPISTNEFTIEHIQKFVLMLEEWTKKIRFVPLMLPSHVECASQHRDKNIYGRYIEAFVLATDCMMARWDFLVQKLD